MSDLKPGDVAINFKAIPKGVRDRYKAYCARKGVSMVNDIVDYMKRCVAFDEQPAGSTNGVKRPG